jgi:5-methylcytosine-specific restriction enzyme A
MAKTSGHGNPNWTRDETILALDLYLSRGRLALSPIDVDVKALSARLREMPYHSEESKQPSFRNPAGVAFKLQNLRSVATGQGLSNVSKMDREVWAELGHQPKEVARLATRIREGMVTIVAGGEAVEEDQEFLEGRIITELHLRRERDARLRRKVLAQRTTLSCDCCHLERSDLPVEWQRSLFEVHHINPLALTGERATRVGDVALLCANCHRLTHAIISSSRRWQTVAEVQAALGKLAASS